MSSKSWIYVIILIIVLAAGGVFFWWMWKTSKITPKAEVTPTPTPQTFTDVSPTYWAYTEIEGVNKAGYMVGYKDFKPDQDATRADAAAAVARAFHKVYDNPTPSFSDVPATYWAYKDIEGLKLDDSISGYSDGTFRPDQAATRSDLAVIVAGTVANGKDKVPDPGSVTSPFSDVSTSDADFKYIYFVYQQDIMSGYPGGTFKPTQNATRADVAAATARAERKGDAGVPTPTTVSFSDVPTTYWAYKYIEYVNSIQAMIGYPPLFKPDDFSDRATVAVAIARATAGSDAAVPAGPATPSYSDVPTTHWAYKYIEYLKSKNIMEGYSDGTFRPDNPPEYAKRFTIAVVLARAKGLALDPAPTTPSFADVATTDPYFKEVEAIYKAGYTQGCGTDAATGKLKFCPTDNLSRAALAVFVYNAYIKVAGVSPSPQPSTPTPAPSTPTPTPTASETLTPTPTPTTTTTTTTTTTGTGTGTTGTAKTGPEIPLLGGGLLGALFLVRYLVGRKVR